MFLLAQRATAQVKAAFSSDVSNGCSPLLVNFKNLSTGIDSTTNYYWDLGNGSTPSQQQNPSALFLNPGSGSVTYTIKLVIKSSKGNDSVTKKSYITVYATPKVAFTSDVTQGCPPFDVKFTDASKAGSGTITNWLWDFGEGALSTKQNPTTTYHYSSTYNVSLSVVNSFGCKQTANGAVPVHVLDTVHAAFNYQYNNICQSPAPITFQNTSQSASNIVSYNWNFGDGNSDGSQSPTHTFANKGTYKVQLIATNSAGCADTLLQNITIGKAGADFSFGNTCANSAVQFSDSSSAVPVSSIWTFGDGTTANTISPQHTFAAAGTYNVTLQANFGSCVGSITKQVTVVNPPKSSFTASASNVCKLPYNVIFNNTSSGASTYQWMFGDTATSSAPNPSHTYTKGGFFDVRLIATAGIGCSDTSILQSAVKVGPPIIDSIQNLFAVGCVPQTISPIAFVRSAEPIASYQWSWGDNSPASNDTTPKHSYTQTGSYTVSLIVATAGGCSDTFIAKKPMVVGVAPKADFNADPLNTCARISVGFADASQGAANTWLWKFGDGGESNLKNTQHHYMDTGWFTVTLIAGYNGCKDTIVKKNYVNIKAPVANYNTAFNCLQPYNRVFTDQSIDAHTWQWDFGDGGSSTSQNPTHTFPKPGTYLVKLKVTNSQCFDTLQVKMQVVDEHPNFTTSAQATAACRNDAITFTITNVNANNISAYNWNFGDKTATGFVSSGAYVTHTYTSTGTFTPTLITQDILGCMDTVVNGVKTTVYGPKAAFGNDTGLCINGTANFYDSSKGDGTHPIQKWLWTYEPNTTQTYTSAASYTHQYATAGLYDVKLVVFDSYGCKDSVIKTKAVEVTNPIAQFSTLDSIKCSKNKVSFTNSSTGKNAKYVWNFGDGTTSTDTSSTITHSYTSEGIYSVSLTMSDQYKCTSVATKQNGVIISNPKAVMLINGPTSTTCPPLLVKPQNQSVRYTSVTWSFGDGSLSKLDTPSHNYIMGGNYDLMLVAKGYGECYDTAHQPINLKGPSGKFTYNPLLHCNPSTVSFVCQTKDAVKVTWDFNDGVVQQDSGANSATHVYKNNGLYLPKLLMTDKDGCFVGLENLDTLYISGAKANFVATSQAGCDSSLAAFVQTSVPYYDQIQSYQWNFGDGTTSSEGVPMHYYKVSGNYQAKLSVKTTGGCNDSISYPINVVVHKTPQVSIAAPDSVCAATQVAYTGFDKLNEPGSGWQWNFGDNTKDSSANSTKHIFSNGGTYNVSAIVTTPSGCADTTTRILNVVALPNVSAGLDSFVCKGGATMLTATGAATYSWQANSTLSCTACATPLAAPSVNTLYSVVGKNTFGCVAQDSVAVEVINPQTITVSNDTLCMGENATLQVSGADNYSWSPALYLDNPASSAPQFHAAKDTTILYTVTGTDRKKCFTDTKTLAVKVYPIPHIEISEHDINLNVGFSTKLNTASSSDVTQWRWEPQAFLSDARIASPVASPQQTITYSCVATNNGSCFARDQVTVHVMCNGANLFVPNTFSPNGDGVNDKFFPHGTGVFNIKSLRIFNRWGQEVFTRTNFTANDESAGWDGKLNGKPLESDVYVYMLEIICENNAVIPFKGNVTLLR